MLPAGLMFLIFFNGLTVVLLKVSTDYFQIQNDPILSNPAKTFWKNL